MKATKTTAFAVTLTRILLGLVMLVPGLIKLFSLGPEIVRGMLSNIGLFAWAPTFWAWVLIVSEIVFGIAIVLNYRLRYAAIPPMIILTVAAFTINWGNWANMLMHFALVSMLWVFSAFDNE